MRQGNQKMMNSYLFLFTAPLTFAYSLYSHYRCLSLLLWFYAPKKFFITLKVNFIYTIIYNDIAWCKKTNH